MAVLNEVEDSEERCHKRKSLRNRRENTSHGHFPPHVYAVSNIIEQVSAFYSSNKGPDGL